MSELSPLIEALTRVANSLEHGTSYTLTGAADWSILVTSFSLFSGIIIAMFGIIMWFGKESVTTITRSIKDHRDEWEKHLDRHTAEGKEAINLLWDETRNIRKDCKDCRAEICHDMKECRAKCCDG